MTRTRELLPARAAAARNPDLTASAARPYVGDSSGSINAITLPCTGGRLATGATGWITGGSGAAATVTVGAGGAGVNAGAGIALGAEATAAGVAVVAVVTRAPDNGGADEHAAASSTPLSAAIVARRGRAESNVEAIEGAVQ
jgi:hypothetical protein